jgi:hypothetical protein
MFSDVERPTDVCGKEHLEERRREVVYPLYVSTGGVAYRPDVQYAFQTLKNKGHDANAGR